MTKKTLKALKGTTFNDLFESAATPENIKLNPVSDDEFNESIVPIAKRVLYKIATDPHEPSYVRIDAIKQLLDRALGKPISRQFNAEADVDDLTDLLPKIVQRPDEEEPS